jgi:hypothetical protein
MSLDPNMMRCISAASAKLDPALSLDDAVGRARDAGGYVIFYILLNKISFRAADNAAIGPFAALIPAAELNTAAEIIEEYRVETARVLYTQMLGFDILPMSAGDDVPIAAAFLAEIPEIPREIIPRAPCGITFSDIYRICGEFIPGLESFAATVRILHAIGHPRAIDARNILASYNIKI